MLSNFFKIDIHNISNYPLKFIGLKADFINNTKVPYDEFEYDLDQLELSYFDKVIIQKYELFTRLIFLSSQKDRISPELLELINICAKQFGKDEFGNSEISPQNFIKEWINGILCRYWDNVFIIANSDDNLETYRLELTL